VVLSPLTFPFTISRWSIPELAVTAWAHPVPIPEPLLPRLPVVLIPVTLPFRIFRWLIAELVVVPVVPVTAPVPIPDPP
jgi:hypothetical protein